MQLPTICAELKEISAPDVLPKHEPTDDSPQSPIVHCEALAVFLHLRTRLLGIACRMLDNVTEAEDLVQEVWLRWQSTDRKVVAAPAAFLATITTRLAINVLDSARVRRESYVGTSILERADSSDAPCLGVERGEALERAVILLMERLTPRERAAYILREAFEYPYWKIAEVVHSTESNSRQLVSRARKHINSGHRTVVNTHEERSLLAAFIDAAQQGNPAALEEVLLMSSQHAIAA